MSVKQSAAVVSVKLVQQLVRLLGKGEGTALPGLLLERLAPEMLQVFARQIGKVILVTGTNGKTTTQKALTSILEQAGYRVLSNSSGSNMRRGLLSLFISRSDIGGAMKYDYAVLEIEEATMPKVTKELVPAVIVVTNLYRDQLDAYGEIDRTKTLIRRGIEMVPRAQIVFNADDPQLQELVKKLKNPVRTYGIAPEYRWDFKYEGKGLTESEAKMSKRPDLLADKIKVTEDLGTRFAVGNEKYVFNSPGVYNVYNALAALAAAQVLGIGKESATGLIMMRAAFGRGEIINHKGNIYRLLLAKNPAGLNLVLDLLTEVKRPNLVLLLNDKIADGRDVSWIWDAELEKLLKIDPSAVYLGGTRAEELLLRLKYVYGSARQISNSEFILGDKLPVFLEPKLTKLIKLFKQGERFYVVPTYTAMLNFRKILLGKALE